MAMPIPSPAVDERSYNEVVSATEELVKAYTGDYPAAPGATPDAGYALIRLFARMAKHVIDRLNRVPDRSFLAFLNMVGVERSAARSARVPLTFSLAAGSESEAIVPAGTRVADSASGKVIFETASELVVSPAKLTSVMVHEPDGDQFNDVTANALGASDEYFYAFYATESFEHSFYISADSILGLGSGTAVTVAITLASASDTTAWHALHTGLAPHLSWSYWNGTSWTALTTTSMVASGVLWTMSFTVPSDMAATTVNGQTALFLRAALASYPDTTIPTIKSVTTTASITVTGLAPDEAYANGAPIDLSMDFYPLGEQPKFNSNLYLASAEVFSKPGAVVGLTVDLSDGMTKVGSSKVPDLLWEVWTGSGWTKLGRSTAAKALSGTSSYSFNDGTLAFTKESGGTDVASSGVTTLGKVSFTLPTGIAKEKLHGTESYWLRVRMMSGDYGTGTQLSTSGSTTTITNDPYTPPIIETIKLSYSYSPSATAACMTLNNGAFTVCSSGTAFVPFSRWEEENPAVYLGFDRAFSAKVMQIYVQVAPLPSSVALAGPIAQPGANKAHVTWEYSTGSGWTSLTCDDSTGSFAQSGYIRFVGPTDFVAKEVFGSSLFWLRARWGSGEYAAPPQIGRIIPNTVLATNTTTIRDEYLGSSNGAASQVFKLTQVPVLDGEVIEVKELEAPSETDLGLLQPQMDAGDVTRAMDAGNTTEEVWVRWRSVPDFSSSSPEDRHYKIDRATGEILFGDGIRGMAPQKGRQNIRAKRYQTGGTTAGNLAAGSVTKLLTTIPYVDKVTNYEEGTGGADEGTAAAVRERGVRVLRHRQSAVAYEDFEDLAYEASSAVALAKAISPTFDPIALVDNPAAVAEAGQVLLLLVPNSTERPPMPSLGLIHEVETYLKARCAPAVSLRISTPIWVEVSVTSMEIVPVSYDGTETLRGKVLEAIEKFLNPLTGGARGTGWAFGQVPHKSDLYRLLAPIPGLRLIRNVTITMVYAGSSPTMTFDEGTAGTSLRNVLIFSGTHSVSIVSPDEDV